MSAPHSSGRIKYGVGHRVVDHQRDAVGVRNTGDALDVEHVVLGVRDDLAEEHLRVRLDGRFPLGEVVGIVDEGDLDAELRQRVVQQVVGAAVQRRRGDDVVAGLAQRHERERFGSLTGCNGERAGEPDRRGAAAFERVDAGFERGLRRVHDAGVDVADLGEAEQVGGVVGVAELVRRRLIDRHRPGAGGRIGLAADVNLLGLETPGVTHRGRTLSPNSRPHKSGFPRPAPTRDERTDRIRLFRSSLTGQSCGR